MPDQPFLTPADLAEIGARVQGVDSMQPKTISQHLFESRREIPLREGGTRKGKYADDPFPPPDDYAGKGQKKPWWSLHREQDIVAWFERHPRRRQGDGIGGAPKMADRRPKEEGPVRRVVPSVTVKRTRGAVEVTVKGQTATFEAPMLKRAIELRQEHPRGLDAVAEALVGEFGVTKTRAREYASAAQRVLDAGVGL
ncbi:hypothetical protein E1211_17960 [Micromonospora sp. 15K316]|nr:hypothetical protein E1211_17960 [Micromonospora sp. 15K316]